MSNLAYEKITNQIIDLLMKGVIPWRRPYQNGIGVPKNLISKKPYRGINWMMLISSDYPSEYFLTFKQVKALGGKVKKGEKATTVVFWKLFENTNADKTNGESKTIPMLRYYHVFNLSQTEGIDPKKIPANPEAIDRELTPIEAAEEIVNNMPLCPEITFGAKIPHYKPSTDVIGMPDTNHFVSDEEYYSTLFHEMVHSTGHAKRLGRFANNKTHHSSKKEYSKEELVAEMGSAFLCHEAKVLPSTIENSASYIKSWIAVLQDDTKMLIQAASMAQKAADFILGVNTEE